MENTTNSATFSITTKGGYNVLLTLREDSIVKAKAILALVEAVDTALTDKGIKAQVKSFGGGFPKKEKAWTGEVCPKDSGRLYKVDYTSKKTGKAGSMLKCENSKYDFTTKETSGCSWVGFGSSLKEIEEKEKVRNFESEYGNA